MCLGVTIFLATYFENSSLNSSYHIAIIFRGNDDKGDGKNQGCQLQQHIVQRRKVKARKIPKPTHHKHQQAIMWPNTS